MPQDLEYLSTIPSTPFPLLNQEEKNQVGMLFDKLSNMDDYMVLGMSSVCEWLQEEAHDTFNLIEDGNFGDANARIKSARQVCTRGSSKTE